ncbi:thioredoxin domain-containing protein 8 isoform X1 [Hyaena hyaena]|uniref:thioredoxin domain-containing protein 8 isoform X1 n=1 Tax=Hyaena hyaena TaxID=95912 RepID=UPI0019233D1C|nr:thioredoxin domain-containing protein 8 isoform X1 [Hyaena hyaena]
MVQIIKDMDELKTFLKAAGCKLVVVEFSAKWCGPCKRIYPLIHAMSLQYRNVMFANVDVDDSKELAQSYHIKSVPTFQMFKQTRKVTLFSRLKRAICCYENGFMSEPIFEFCGADAQKLEAKIQELIGPAQLSHTMPLRRFSRDCQRWNSSQWSRNK